MKAKGIPAAILALAMVNDAEAHTVVAGIDGFPGGLLHPLLVTAHAAALLALGLFAGGQPRRARLILVTAFAAGLVAGMAAVSAAIAVFDAERALLALAALTGLGAAAAWQAPVALAAPLAAAAGAALIFDSVPMVVSARDTLLALTGTGLTAVLGLSLVAGAAAFAGGWVILAVRIAGSWIAASALLVLALRVGAH